MLRTSLVTASMLLAAVASAQTDSTKPAEAPALVTTVAPETNDSPLVQAAKRAVAARQRITVKIDNTNVKNATKLMTTTDNMRALPAPLAPALPAQQKPKVAVLPAAEAKKPAPRPVMRPRDDAEQGPYADAVDEEQPPAPAPGQPQPSRKPPR